MTLILLIAGCVMSAQTSPKPAPPAATGCEFSDAGFNTQNDIHALDQYKDAIAELLKDEKFDLLDCLADTARKSKAKFSGGGWKLRNIYLGLESPRPGHPTEVDWEQHFSLVEAWVDKNPQSVTAPIVLAESYVRYAWAARGTGYSDSVSNSGWKLFGQRMEKAKQILETAAQNGVKCPDWYVAMQEIAQGAGWEHPEATALFQKATAFEPTYQYYYRLYASYLLPKWNGEEGDAAQFAEESANRIGGADGDLLYFQIADAVICGCQDPEIMHFSWPRLQKGYAALEKKYGMSLRNVNTFALMGVKWDDWVVAAPAFQQLGDNWDKDLWVTREWFTSNRDIATQRAEIQARARAVRKEAEENMQTAQGKTYWSQVEPKLASYEQNCVKDASLADRKFEFLILVGKDGGVKDAHTYEMPTPMGMCLMKAFYEANIRKETVFAAPPRDAYWLILEIDPTMFAASAK